MIKFKDGEMLDLVPPHFKEQPDWIAFSYALKMAMQKLIAFSETTRMYAAVDFQPENILDYMALELRSPYYEESADVETKRTIIKKTISWYMKAGTKASVEELVETILGDGKVVEWMDFAGGPGTPGVFDIETGSFLVADIYDRLSKIIERQKDLTSHLRRILVKRDGEINLFVGMAIKQTKFIYPIDQELEDPLERLIWLADENGELLVDERGIILAEEI